MVESNKASMISLDEPDKYKKSSSKPKRNTVQCKYRVETSRDSDVNTLI